MNIELKKLKIAEHMSEETTAFTADIYIDGKQAGYAKNDGHGGATYYHPYEGKRDLIGQAEKFCEGLPDRTYDMGKGRDPFVMKMNLENFIDELVENELKKKADKKISKKFATALIFENGNKIYTVDFKKPLSSVPDLQKLVNLYRNQMKVKDPKAKLMNTNLEALGIK